MIQCIGYDKKRKAYVYKNTETGEITYEKDTEVEESIEEPIKLSNEKVESKQIYDPETMTMKTTAYSLTIDTCIADDIPKHFIDSMYEPTKILPTIPCIICNDPAAHPICDSCKAAMFEL